MGRKLDYERRGAPPYGLNRQLAEQSSASNRVASYAVYRGTPPRLVETFDTHDSALARLGELGADDTAVIRRIS